MAQPADNTLASDIAQVNLANNKRKLNWQSYHTDIYCGIYFQKCCKRLETTQKCSDSLVSKFCSYPIHKYSFFSLMCIFSGLKMEEVASEKLRSANIHGSRLEKPNIIKQSELTKNTSFFRNYNIEYMVHVTVTLRTLRAIYNKTLSLLK
jgi:hypothetical protein